MRKVAYHNLGCKVNSYEMDVMIQSLKDRGFEIVPFDEKADIYIVNTCTVTNIADRKSRQMLHRAKKTNPEGIVVAVGCYVQTGKEQVEADAAVDLIIGNNRKKDLVGILENYLESVDSNGAFGVADEYVIDINHTDEYEQMRLTRTQEHTRAYIKIQDGCNQFCTYCIIPYARGRVRSRKESDIIDEIKGLCGQGYKEFVLTGIHISSYGYSLLKLLGEIDKIDGVERIRLGSLEPRVITKEFAEGISKLEHICPHFHLSLQSGCESVLKRMNRHYTPEEYLKGVEMLRGAFEHPAITTDIIVGFPGETPDEFEQTVQFAQKIGFYEMHIFKYSKRKGTKAAVMPNQISEEIKGSRSNILLELEKMDSQRFREYYVGKDVQVLVEETKTVGNKEYCIGHTKEYVKVALETKINENTLVTGKITGFLTDELLKMI